MLTAGIQRNSQLTVEEKSPTYSVTKRLTDEVTWDSFLDIPRWVLRVVNDGDKIISLKKILLNLQSSFKGKKKKEKWKSTEETVGSVCVGDSDWLTSKKSTLSQPYQKINPRTLTKCRARAPPRETHFLLIYFQFQSTAQWVKSHR